MKLEGGLLDVSTPRHCLRILVQSIKELLLNCGHNLIPDEANTKKKRNMIDNWV